jgi:hypothetical protein
MYHDQCSAATAYNGIKNRNQRLCRNHHSLQLRQKQQRATSDSGKNNNPDHNASIHPTTKQSTYEIEYGNVMDCASPAVANDVYWRINLEEAGALTSNGFGHPYQLLATWNVDKKHWNTTDPGKSRDAIRGSNRTSLAEGFIMVDLDGQKATCEMHGYRSGPEMIWAVEELAEPPEQITAH